MITVVFNDTCLACPGLLYNGNWKKWRRDSHWHSSAGKLSFMKGSIIAYKGREPLFVPLWVSQPACFSYLEKCQVVGRWQHLRGTLSRRFQCMLEPNTSLSWWFLIPRVHVIIHFLVWLYHSVLIFLFPPQAIPFKIHNWIFQMLPGGVGNIITSKGWEYAVLLAEMQIYLPHSEGRGLLKLHMSPPNNSSRTMQSYPGHDPTTKNHCLG